MGYELRIECWQSFIVQVRNNERLLSLNVEYPRADNVTLVHTHWFEIVLFHEVFLSKKETFTSSFILLPNNYSRLSCIPPPPQRHQGLEFKLFAKFSKLYFY